MHPVLLVALLAQVGRELGPVPDAVQESSGHDFYSCPDKLSIYGASSRYPETAK
jgi:hypothetical protein